MTRPVLIAGVPRSGTSWALKVLGRAQDAVRVYEPDNETLHPHALRAKRGLGRFPVLSPADPSPSLAALWDRALLGPAGPRQLARRWAESLWEGGSVGARRAAVDGEGTSPRLRLALALAAVPERRRPWVPAGGRHRVVKSVHCLFALEWIAAAWDPAVVLVTRDPRNVIASWLEMDIGDRDRALDRDPLVRRRIVEPLGLPVSPLGDDPVRRAAWHLGVLSAALDAAAAAHPDWAVVAHEDLCADPHARFLAVAERAGLEWTDACDAYLEQADAEGSGYEVRRVAALQRDRWRDRLTPPQVTAIEEELARFPGAADRRPMEPTG